MRVFHLLVFSKAVLLFAALTVFAQVSISSWPFLAEVISTVAKPGLYDLVVSLEVMDKAREDLGDLRLFDTQNREIPYALRVRREVNQRREVGGNIFNHATVGSTASEVSVDVGENPGEHNEIEIQTTGTNFRRRVNLEGSDSGNDWRTLKSDGVIFAFSSQDRAVESNRVNYPTSRYRYLRVRVFADEMSDSQVPRITEVKVMMAQREEGELTTWELAVPYYQLLRNQGAPASAWLIDLGGRVPCDRLALNITEPSFSRPFQVEAVDDPQNARLIATGELSRRLGEEPKPLVIRFDDEQYVRRLRLIITDHSNQPVTINSIHASAPARQLVFELKQEPSLPLRMAFGNPKITEPHYDFEKELAAKLAAVPTRVAVGAVVTNAFYEPEPLPLTERVPWLIYVVLAASSIALGLILFSLARTAMQKLPSQAEESARENSTV